MCWAARLSSAAGVPGLGLQWDTGEKGTVLLVCPGGLPPETEANVPQPRIQLGGRMRTVTGDSGWQLSRVEESALSNSGVRTTGYGNSANRLSGEVSPEMPSRVGLGDSGNVAVQAEAIATRLDTEI